MERLVTLEEVGVQSVETVGMENLPDSLWESHVYELYASLDQETGLGLEVI